jgi:hypothetical protein
MNEPRYFFGCCAFNESIYVFGGMNQSVLQQTLQHGESKCLNSIERFIIDEQKWVTIELKTYQKFPHCSHITAVPIPWDKENILIVGGQTYNKKLEKFENLGMVYKFDPTDEKLKACKNLASEDRFLMGMGITDVSKQVACLGEKYIHLFDGTDWKLISRDTTVQTPIPK